MTYRNKLLPNNDKEHNNTPIYHHQGGEAPFQFSEQREKKSEFSSKFKENLHVFLLF